MKKIIISIIAVIFIIIVIPLVIVEFSAPREETGAKSTPAPEAVADYN